MAWWPPKEKCSVRTALLEKGRNPAGAPAGTPSSPLPGSQGCALNQGTCSSLEHRPCRQQQSKQSHSISLSPQAHTKVLFSKTMWVLMRIGPNENYFLKVVLNLFCTFTVVSWPLLCSLAGSWPLLCSLAGKSFYPAADSLWAEHSTSGS